MLGTLVLLAVGIGDPQVLRHNDPITDVEVIAATWTAGNASLAVGCVPSRNEVRVIFQSDDHYFGRPGILVSHWPLTYRFDAAKPVTNDWRHDNHTAEASGSGDVAAFVRELMASNVLVMRARERFGRGDPFDVKFALGNARPAIDQVIAACSASKVAKKLNL